MTKKLWVTAQANETAVRRFGGAIAVGALALLLLAPEGTNSAYAAGEKPVTLESISGSKVKRITLTEMAAKRLGIQTGTVGEDKIDLKRIVGGAYVMPQSIPPAQTSSVGGLGTFSLATGTPVAPVPQTSLPTRSADEGLVRVMFCPAEWEKVAKDQPARIYKLSPTGEPQAIITARPSGAAPLEDFKRAMLMYFYTVNGKDHGLEQNERVRVEVPLTSSGEVKKVVPYSSIYYDQKGEPWVYVTTKPLVYERKPVKIDRIVGNKVALSSGPELGAKIVTVGAALLFGTEIYGK